MKKKNQTVLVIMAMVTALALTACGNKETADETGRPVAGTPESLQSSKDSQSIQSEVINISNEVPDTEGEGAPAQENPDEEKIAGEHNQDVTQQQIEIFAGRVKTAVANKDMEALAGLCDYPLYLDGEAVKDEAAFLMLDKDKLFTDRFLKETADAAGSELERFGAGIAMGAETSIFMNDIDGELKITSITVE